MIVLRLPDRFPLRPLLALLVGVLHAAAFRSDASWPLEIAALAALVALCLRRLGTWDALGLGFAFGLGWFVTGIYWIFISIHTYGQINAVLAGAATLLLSAYLALYPAAACGLGAFWATRSAHRAGFVWLFAPLWTLAEMARGTVLTGFPWMATGYAHVGGPLAGYAPVLGVAGVTFMAAACAAALARAAHRAREPRGTLGPAALILAIAAGGLLLAAQTWSTPLGPVLHVRLLQGNIPQDVKFDPERFDATVATYLELIERRPADLIVLPETALPVFLGDVPESLIERLEADAARLHAGLAIGVPIADSAQVYTNSVIAFDAVQGGAQRYDKTHLVPFGEFVPFGFRWFVDLMHVPLGDFTPGSPDQKPLRLAGIRVAFNICYEDLFGAVIRRQAKEANLLVNVSNVAWFGDSQALPQHLQLSRMRALETARPMLRATNTGMTAAIDARGTVQSVLQAFTTGSLDVSVQPVTGTTPYVFWGDLAALGLTLAVLALAALRTVKAPGGRYSPPEPVKM